VRRLLNHMPMTDQARRAIPSSVSSIQFQILQLYLMDTRFEGETDAGRCVWLKDGRRVEFDLVAGGGFVAALCKGGPDPLYPGREPGCTYPNCKCVVSTSTSKPWPDCGLHKEADLGQFLADAAKTKG
jgi:hypothetical protein